MVNKMVLKKMFIDMRETPCEKCGNDESDHDVRYVSKYTVPNINGKNIILSTEGFVVFCKECKYEWFVKGE